MISLGLDIATNTGWSVLNEKKELIEFGPIQINPQMSLPQRIIFLSNEIIRILDKHKPDCVFIEDLICGISGVKTLSYLARLNGAAILTCTKYVNNNIYFYNPPEWKKNSFDGLIGSSSKLQVQVAVVNYYKMNFGLSEGEYNDILIVKQTAEDNITKHKDEISFLKCELLKKQKQIIKKRNPLTKDEICEVNTKIDETKLQIIQKKKEFVIFEKSMKKIFNNLSLQITSRTGIDQNISDSIAINFCGLKNIVK